MTLYETIQVYWQEHADPFLKALLIHLQQYDQVHNGELNSDQSQQLQHILTDVYQADYTVDKAQVYIELANALPLVVMYYLLKSTQQENRPFIDDLLSYVFEQEDEQVSIFKAKNIDLEKAQLLIRYLGCDTIAQLEKKLS